MKFRTITFIALATIFLSACSFSLAEDVTPPPGAVMAAAPTHGPIFPAQAPDLNNGAAIYAEKCVPCHGETGLGDGPQSKDLPLPVAAIGLPEVARKVTPADWYLVVTTGNLDRFMPPFSSLSDQERWDVVSYAMTLSTAPDQIEQGKSLYEANCAECHQSTPEFATQQRMSELSVDAMDATITNGVEGKMQGFGDTLSADDRYAIISYLRSLTYSAASPTPVPASPTQAESAQTTETPLEGTPQAEVPTEAPAQTEGIGPVTGKIVNQSGGEVPSGLSVTLHGFDHATDPNSTPQEIVTDTVTAQADGSYRFDDVEMPEGRIFLTEVDYAGVTFQSELSIVEAGNTEVTIPDLPIYESTTDLNNLVIDQLHISFDLTTPGTAQVFEVYSIRNSSDKAVTVESDGTDIPFMPMPQDATNVGFELSQDSAFLLPADNGFAIPPNQDRYSIIAYYNLPYDNGLDFSQPLALNAQSMVVIVPDGFKAKNDQFTDEGLQSMQEGVNVQVYSTGSLNAGDTIEFSVSGKIKTASPLSTLDNRQLTLIGAGAIGVALILAGVWMFLRDRKRSDEDDDFEDDDDEDEFDSADNIMDAIIALDDLHRAKKIPEEAYQKRRAELMARLKEQA